MYMFDSLEEETPEQAVKMFSLMAEQSIIEMSGVVNELYCAGPGVDVLQGWSECTILFKAV